MKTKRLSFALLALVLSACNLPNTPTQPVEGTLTAFPTLTGTSTATDTVTATKSPPTLGPPNTPSITPSPLPTVPAGTATETPWPTPTRIVSQVPCEEDPDCHYVPELTATPTPDTISLLCLGAGCPVHIVRAGETLSGIAACWGTTYPAIAQVNDLAPPYIITVGQRLLIPQWTKECIR